MWWREWHASWLKLDVLIASVECFRAQIAASIDNQIRVLFCL